MNTALGLPTWGLNKGPVTHPCKIFKHQFEVIGEIKRLDIIFLQLASIQFSLFHGLFITLGNNYYFVYP